MTASSAIAAQEKRL